VIPPVVLLHPFPFDSRVFDRLTAELPGVRILTPDLHGAGAPDLSVLADQVAGGLDAAGIDTAVVGGVSMGGYVVLNLLRRYPDRLAGLILIDTKATADDAQALANRAAVADRADNGLRPDTKELLKGMVSAQTLTERPQVVAELTVIIEAQPVAEIAWNQRAMATRPDSTSLLAATELPVLVIVGADDALTPPAGSRQMAASARQSTLMEIAEAGHLAIAEDPVAVGAAIDRWLRRKLQ
jgi:pimeloyl-ACP methyl ester carboxylesterase